jgi:ABC-type sugar transport system ATPase subunit
MAFPLKAIAMPAAAIAERVQTAAQRLGQCDQLHRRPAELSGGQRQRVALGRAMVRTPTVYLLDEPLSNLDQQLRVQMRSELKDLHQRLGATMLYVTHDQSEAMTLSDLIVVMSAGRIEQVGTPRELYDRPANLFVARFLGEPGMNVLEGKAGNGHVAGAGFSVALPPKLAGAGKAIAVGIRPEDLEYDPSEAAAFRGQVRTVEYLGARSLLRVDVGETLVSAFLPASVELSPGAAIGLSPADTAKLRFFDSQTGLTL